MSSDRNFAALLNSIQINLYRYGGSILMTMGTVSCVLSLLVFTQKNLRKNPCAIYFIAYNISNLLLIYTSMLFTTLSIGFAIDLSSYNLIACRFRFYALFLFDLLSPSYLILASVDRTFVTSMNALTRQRSTSRLAYRFIAAVTLVCLVGHSHALIFTTLFPVASGGAICYLQQGAQITATSYYTLAFKVILIPGSMIILGMWTVRNVRRMARITPAPAFTVIAATTHAASRTVQSKDRQLIKILLMDINLYIIFNILTVITLLKGEFTKYQTQTYAQAVLQTFLLSVSIFCTYVPCCISCYTNLLISKTFRHEVKNILLCK